MAALTAVDMTTASKQLVQSETGRKTLRAILVWLDESGCSLDAQNQSAVQILLEGAWGRYPGSSRDAIRSALGIH